mgnify:FL=1
MLEDKIKCCINLIGDYEYQSDKLYPRKLVIELKDGHYKYTNNQEIRKELVKFKNHEDKKYVLYIPKDGYFVTFDGEMMVNNRQLKYEDLNKSKTCNYKKFNINQKEKFDKKI